MTRHGLESYLARLYETAGRQWAHPVDNLPEFKRWQARTRPRLRRLLMLHQRTQADRVPLRLKRKVVAETPDYVRERISYFTLPGVMVPAWLLIPKKTKLPAPALLCPPGHGAGMNQVLDESPGSAVATPGTYKQYPLELVKRGFVCLVPEHAGFGERLGEEGNNRRSTHACNYLSLNLMGESQIGLMTWDLMRALDVLERLPEVRRDRIGCYGLSLGGETTLFLTALDRRVRAACISGFVTSYKSSFLDQQHCGCGYSFALARYLELVDIAALIAPRPLLLESATRDPIFYVDAARDSYRQLAKVYSLFGARKDIAQEIFEGKHEISGKVAFDWLTKQLGRVS